MRQYNPKNERVKYRYFRELKEAEGKGVATIKAARNALYKYDKPLSIINGARNL